MHKSEIRRLAGLVSQKGYTLIPLSLYQTRGLVKMQLALAKGKNSMTREKI